MTRPAEDLYRSYSLRVSSRYSCNPPGLYRPNGCLPCRFYRKNRRDRRVSPFPRPNWSARDTPTQRPALPPRGAPTAFSPPLSAPTGSTEIGSMPTSIISASKKLSPRFRLLVFISFPPSQKYRWVFKAEYLRRVRHNIAFPKKTNCLISFGKAKGRRRMASVPPFA